MKTVRIPSPARSTGPGPRTPIRHRHRRTLSVSSARSNASGRLTALIQQSKNSDSFVVSPLANRKSILSDNTEIEEPRRKSWWKNLDENSRDVTELLEENKNVELINIIEELDIEILSQEKRNCTMDLPESSDSESINSIVIPQRKLFMQKENKPQKKFGEIISTRETMTKLYKPNANVDNVNVQTRELFQNKHRSKPIFPAALLNISPNKTTADKTKELVTVEPQAQVRNIFGNRVTKRKNIFSNFIVSESEDEIPEIQPKVFGFQKKLEARRRASSSSRGLREPSPASSITTDIEMDDWKMLPSSTMVEHQLEIMMADGNSPKRTRLSKLIEIECDSTKQSNKSVSSKEMEKSRKSKTFTKERALEPHSMVEEIFGPNEESSNKPRKSKTFTKEKASESMATRNKTKYSQDGDVEGIFEQNQDVQNKSCIDTDKSRKSKTFIKEKAPAIEASMTKKTSKVSQDQELVENHVAHNKSKDIDQNTSQSSIKTRSQSKANSPNNSQIISKELTTKTAEIKTKNISYMAIVQEDINIETNETPSLEVNQENDDDELNFTLEYENEEIPETILSKSNMKTRASKSMTERENSANVSKPNKTLPNKVIDEAAKLKSTHKKSNRSLKVKNKSSTKNVSVVVGKIEINQEQTAQPNVSNSSYLNSEKNEMEVDEDYIQQETAENQQVDNIEESKTENDESEVEKTQKQEGNNDTNEIEDVYQDQHSVIASGLEGNEDEPDNVSQEAEDLENDVNISQELDEEELNESQEEPQNESEVQNESLEEPHNESEVQNESLEEPQNESEVQNESLEEPQNESEVQNESLEEPQNESEVQNESLEEPQNESEVHNESQEEPQNDSEDVNEDEEEEAQNTSQEVEDTEEQNESEVDEQESDAIAESDNENDISQDDIPNDSDNNDNDQEEVIESGQDEIETSNVSHDTTGRNRKKDESPEVILHDSANHLDSFEVQVRNTSVRKTETIKSLNIRPSLVPVRESTGFSDGKNSSSEGSGWDSHRTTRKTLRQTFGRDFTPRKSLRALVMEKSAKRQTQHNDIASVTAKFPQANSTELPEMSNRYEDEVDENEEPNHEISLRTRQTKLEECLQKIKQKNTEIRFKMEEAVRNSLKAPSKDHVFKVPARPLFARRQTKPTKPKQAKSTLFLGELPAEVIEDLKYKPPKRFQPSNASWITKHLYKFLEAKLEPKYDYKARVRAEKLVEHIYHFAKDLRRQDVAATDAVDVLKHEMARLDVVKTHFEFYEFFHQFMPREVRVKVVPDVVNKISLPKRGVFSDII